MPFPAWVPCQNHGETSCLNRRSRTIVGSWPALLDHPPVAMSLINDLAPRRICVIKPSALGDVVQALPVLGAIRNRFPEAHIAWVINANLANLLKGHRHIDELILFQRHGNFADGWQLVRSLHAGRFDLTLDLQGLLRTGLMTAATRATCRIGMMTAREGAERFCTATFPNTDFQRPAWQRYQNVAREFDPKNVATAELPITPFDYAYVDEHLGRMPRPWLAICPGARWETKQWPAKRFVEVAIRAHCELGASIVVLGSPTEQKLCQKIANAITKRISTGSCVNLGGKTSLRQLAAALQRCQWALTNDSGPLHLADAVGTPTVGLFTCTSPVRSGPPPARHELIATRVPCAAGYHKTCPMAGTARHACHVELDADRVWAGLARLVRWTVRNAG